MRVCHTKGSAFPPSPLQALEEGLSCGEVCDKYYAIHKATYDWFDVKFDR